MDTFVNIDFATTWDFCGLTKVNYNLPQILDFVDKSIPRCSLQNLVWTTAYLMCAYDCRYRRIYFYYIYDLIRIRIKLKFSGLVLRKLHMFYKFALSFHWRISEEKTYKVQYFLDTWHLRDVVLCPANSNAFDAQHHNKLVRIEINPRFISMQCITFHFVAHK